MLVGLRFWLAWIWVLSGRDVKERLIFEALFNLRLHQLKSVFTNESSEIFFEINTSSRFQLPSDTHLTSVYYFTRTFSVIYLKMFLEKSLGRRLEIKSLYLKSSKIQDFIWSLDIHKFMYLVAIYVFKVNNGNTSIMLDICSTLTIKAPEKRY